MSTKLTLKSNIGRLYILWMFLVTFVFISSAGVSLRHSYAHFSPIVGIMVVSLLCPFQPQRWHYVSLTLMLTSAHSRCYISLTHMLHSRCYQKSPVPKKSKFVSYFFNYEETMNFLKVLMESLGIVVGYDFIFIFFRLNQLNSGT